MDLSRTLFGERLDFKPFKIGKYLLLERLATGGMAEVYRAKASGAGGFEKQLAIKRILPTYSQNEEFRRMFEYEARLSSMLTHANIVQIYDFVKSGDTYLLAMEYVDGKNLRQFVNKAKKVSVGLPVEFGVYVINEVCKGLEYAHKKKDDLNGRPLNIIHRDMSPQNIMISYDGAVKIVDFGIAKAKDRVDETRSGVIKGKFGYMSPEQANGEQVDHRTDIFSTGIILYELLTGKRLFAAENDMATLKLIQECIIPPPSRQNPKITSDLEKILLKALTKDLKLRYNDPGNFHRSLQEYLNKYFPSFTQKEASEILQKVFKDEIDNEKKRFEQIHRQSIPFSQGDSKPPTSDFEDIEEALDGDVTKSEAGSISAVTYVDADEEVGIPAEIDLPDELDLGGESHGDQSDEEKEEKAGATKVEPIFLEDEPVSNTKGGRRGDSSISGLFIGSKASKTGNTEKTKVTGEETLLRDDKMPTVNTPTPTSNSYRKKPAPQKKREVTNSGEEEAIVLSNSVSGVNALPRRRGSISAITNMGKSQVGDESISLVSLGDATPVRSVDPTFDDSGPRRKPDYYPEREDYLPRRKRSAVLSFMFFCGVLAGTVYLYQLYLNGRVPELMRIISGERGPTNEADDPGAPISKIDVPDYPVERRPGGDCTVRVESDPSGAKVFVQNKERGITSTTLSSPCNESVNLVIRLDGYEAVSENVVITNKSGRIYKTLKKIPTGRLELTLNRNATIYIEGNPIAEARADEKVEIPLRAKRKHKLRFVNEILGIDTEREFFIEEDAILRQPLSLEDSNPRKK